MHWCIDAWTSKRRNTDAQTLRCRDKDANVRKEIRCIDVKIQCADAWVVSICRGVWNCVPWSLDMFVESVVLSVL